MVSRALFLIYSSAFLLVLYSALLLLVLCADSVVTCRALLDIHSIANLFHLGVTEFFLLSAALLFIGSAALVLVRCLCLILSATIPVRLVGYVRRINGER